MIFCIIDSNHYCCHRKRNVTHGSYWFYETASLFVQDVSQWKCLWNCVFNFGTSKTGVLLEGRVRFVDICVNETGILLD